MARGGGTEGGELPFRFLEAAARNRGVAGRTNRRRHVRYILLWLLGIPIPLLILIWLFFR